MSWNVFGCFPPAKSKEMWQQKHTDIAAKHLKICTADTCHSNFIHHHSLQEMDITWHHCGIFTLFLIELFRMVETPKPLGRNWHNMLNISVGGPQAWTKMQKDVPKNGVKDWYNSYNINLLNLITLISLEEHRKKHHMSRSHITWPSHVTNTFSCKSKEIQNVSWNFPFQKFPSLGLEGVFLHARLNREFLQWGVIGSENWTWTLEEEIHIGNPHLFLGGSMSVFQKAPLVIRAY